MMMSTDPFSKSKASTALRRTSTTFSRPFAATSRRAWFAISVNSHAITFFAPAFAAQMLRMPLPAPTSSTTLSRKFAAFPRMASR